jgi:hypothetical protein
MPEKETPKKREEHVQEPSAQEDTVPAWTAEDEAKLNALLEIIKKAQEDIEKNNKIVLDAEAELARRKSNTGAENQTEEESNESKNESIIKKGLETKEFITIEDIPTYMYGDKGLGNVLKEQTDNQARTMANYAGMFNIKTGQDNREHFGGVYMDREYISKGGKTSDAEIITKEQIKEHQEKQIGKKPSFLER